MATYQSERHMTSCNVSAVHAPDRRYKLSPLCDLARDVLSAYKNGASSTWDEAGKTEVEACDQTCYRNESVAQVGTTLVTYTMNATWEEKCMWATDRGVETRCCAPYTPPLTPLCMNHTSLPSQFRCVLAGSFDSYDMSWISSSTWSAYQHCELPRDCAFVPRRRLPRV